MMHSFGSKIPNFISTHFSFMSEVVRLLNKEGDVYIDRKRFELLASKWEVPIESLLKYRIAYEVDGAYEIDERVADFIAFANNDYALTSPESVQKYYHPLQQFYDNLLAAEERNDLLRICRNISRELRDFSNALESSKTRLLNEALSLQDRSEKMTPQERFMRATEIIRFYVEPLKAMVEDSDRSMLALIRMIGQLALVKMQTVIDSNVLEVLHRLRRQSDGTHEVVVAFGKKVIQELMTLRKLQKNNAILSWAISWLEHRDTSAPSHLAEPYRFQAHRKEFFFDALESLESLTRVEIPVRLPSPESLEALRRQSLHHFSATEHLKQLDLAMPVSNIFRWIYVRLERDEMLTFENYFSALSLVNNYTLSFTDQRDRLLFENHTLDVPIVHATHRDHRRNRHENV